MEIQELKTALINKNIIDYFGKIIIFTGEESYLQDIYIKQIARVYEGKIIFGDDYMSIKENLTAGVAFDGFKVLILRDSKEFLNTEGIIEKIKQTIIPNRLLILIFTKVDARKKFFKIYKNITCNFDKMTEKQLVNIIGKKYNMTMHNKELLCKIAKNDYGRLMLELDKLEMLSLANQITMDQAFTKALRDDLIYQECSDTSFDLVTAMLNKDLKRCFRLSEELREFAEDPFKFLGLIYSNYRNLLLLKSSSNVNISYFIKRKLMPYTQKFSVGELMDNLSCIQDMEEGIKSGRFSSKQALDLIIIMTQKGVKL